MKTSDGKEIVGYAFAETDLNVLDEDGAWVLWATGPYVAESIAKLQEAGIGQCDR